MIVNRIASGLGEKEVAALQQLYGKNRFQAEYSRKLPVVILDIIREPMFILLSLATLLYFLSGELAEGCAMVIAILIVSSISVYNEARSGRALDALRQYTSAKVTVIRDTREQYINTEELVPGDIILLKEGDLIPADAIIDEANDLTVNESILTGESIPVERTTGMIYQGTLINSGKCIATVQNTGNSTELGRLGKAISKPAVKKTQLQIQIDKSVRFLAEFGLGAFVIICVISFMRTGDFTGSILVGLTLAMSAIPEEIPVAFSSFMALGAYYMAGKGIITRQAQTIENLGAVSTLCIDKTGTITANKMKVAEVYSPHTPSGDVLSYAALASERHPFDNMETAILEAFNPGDPLGNLLPDIDHEYALEGHPPMMTHVNAVPQGWMAAAKGAPERIMSVCNLTGAIQENTLEQLKAMTKKGYRVLGIASAMHKGQLPEKQEAFNWKFEGLVGLYDPPLASVPHILGQLKRAGIQVKMLTGDHPETAVNIAEKVRFTDSYQYVTGEEVMSMSEDDLKRKLKEVSIFARMYPEAKLKIINVLKSTGEIVAMTGDGINDGLALKAANVGISMGNKSAEIARLAADMVITDNDLHKIPEAVEEGRKIYENLRKAIRYIISIHIPIILTATVPLLLNWKYPVILSPIHIIFMELIMGPTCSIFFQREAAEKDLLASPPRKTNVSLFNRYELIISLVQGLVITTGLLLLYRSYMEHHTIAATRTVVFLTMLMSNLLLTFANRSFSEPLTTTIRYKNNLTPVIAFASLIFIAAILLLAPVRTLFGLEPISGIDLLVCIFSAVICVEWFEVYKAIRKSN